MTSFDIAVIAVIALSTLFAFLRGFIREVIALVAWVVGIVAALAFTGPVALLLPDVFGHPAVRYVVAFALILLAALLAGALIAWPLARAVRAIGLGFVDRFLGSIFGLLRGLALAVAFVLVAGLTSLPRTAWWQSSALAAPLVGAALVVAAHLPRGLADALDYSPAGHPGSAGTQTI